MPTHQASISSKLEMLPAINLEDCVAKHAEDTLQVRMLVRGARGWQPAGGPCAHCWLESKQLYRRKETPERCLLTNAAEKHLSD